MGKWFYTALLVLAFAGTSHAQMPMMGMGGGAKGGGKMNIGKFYGKLLDAKDGKPVGTATVVLMNQETDKKTGKKKYVILKGTNSDDKGEFGLDEIPVMGTYKLEITEVGYKTYDKEIFFDLSAMAKMKSGGGSGGGDMSQGIPSNAGAMLDAIDKDLGNIKLTPDDKQLSGVTITAQTPQFRLEGEKKIFDVGKNLISQGGTAQDVMKSVPGVIVDINNNVTLRNAAPLIYVDGQPTTLQLDQIPADMIESVEIITNPSAKYDAAGGTGGILNIVLKKNKAHGYNGDVRAGVDSRGGYNAGGDLSIRQGKFNLSANAMLMDINSLTNGYTNRTTFNDTPNTKVNQNNHMNTMGGFRFARVGLDYFVTNRMTLSATGMFAAGGFDPNSNFTSTTTTLNPTPETVYSKQNSTTNNTVKFGSYTLNMKHLFAKEGEEWTALATYNGANFHLNSNYTTDFYNNPNYTPLLGEYTQKTDGFGQNKYYIGQTDFTYPFSKNAKLETGLKGTQQNLESNNENYIYIPTTKTDSLIPNASPNYTSVQQIFAGYVTYSNTIGDYSFHAGLRAESSNYTGNITNEDSSFKQNYPVSLFPSAFVSRKLKHDQELQFSYRRGIIRPTFFQMLPFINYSDPLNLTEGNANLKPSFTNSVEFNYLKNFKSNDYLLISLYYKHSTGLITPYQTPGRDTLTHANTFINSYINANSSDKYGTEITAQRTIKKWWNVLCDLNIYNGAINANNVPGNTPQSNEWSWFAKLNNNFTLPKDFTIQLSGVYQSKTNLLPDNNSNGMNGMRGSMQMAASAAQGYLGANYSIDIAIKKTFLKSKALTASLSVNDIFRTRGYLEHSSSAYFTQDYYQLRDPQLVRFNLSWRFGKMDMDLFKRKDIKSEMDNMKNAQDNFGG